MSPMGPSRRSGPLLQQRMSVASRKRQLATKVRRVVKGHFQTHALQQSRGSVEIAGSGIQLIEQRLRFLQIECIEALGEPAVERREKLVGFLPLALIAPEPRHARCGAEFPGFTALPLGDVYRLI
jgi:hypothetical protein